MKTIRTGELFQHLSTFLSAKGVELKEGTYVRRVQQGCDVLTKVINVSQSSLEKARKETGRKLDQVRQAIHEKTAPKAPPPPPGNPAASAPAATNKRSRRKPAAKQPRKPTRRKG